MNRISCVIFTIFIYRCCLVSSAEARGFAEIANVDGASNAETRQSGDATYYNLGLTACGKTFTDNDLVAAIGFNYFTTPNPNNDPMCGRTVIVTDPTSGKSVTVTVQDKCYSCSPNDIDLSPAAFKQLRDLSVGRFRVDWNFV